MKTSLKTYALTDLQRLAARVQAEIKKRGEKSRRDVLRQLRRVAKQHGFDLASLVGDERGSVAKKARATRKGSAAPALGAKRIDKRRKVAPKYRHPNEKDLTWTGRGRRPRWVVKWLAAKGTMEQLAIK